MQDLFKKLLLFLQVNAAYFKEQLVQEFNPEKLLIVPFRVSLYETREIVMMYARSYFNYGIFRSVFFSFRVFLLVN